MTAQPLRIREGEPFYELTLTETEVEALMRGDVLAETQNLAITIYLRMTFSPAQLSWWLQQAAEARRDREARV